MTTAKQRAWRAKFARLYGGGKKRRHVKRTRRRRNPNVYAGRISRGTYRYKYRPKASMRAGAGFRAMFGNPVAVIKARGRKIRLSRHDVALLRRLGVVKKKH